MGGLRIVLVVSHGARCIIPLLGRGGAILGIRRLLLTKQTTHGGGLGGLFALTALDAMLSPDG